MNTTKSAQFTPGPWELSAGRVITTKSGQFYLTYGKDKYGNPLFKDFVELDHNANLIAAAPAMYEALVRFAKAIKTECYDEDILVDIYHDVRDALAQAEGRQA